MKRYSKAQKALFFGNALGVLLVVGALALFALAGSGFVFDVLRHAAGFALGLFVVMLLTGSPERGGLVAALLLLAALVGVAGLLLVVAEPAADERAPQAPEFVAGVLVSVVAASTWRLLGVNPMGPRGDQASSRRRV